jgi:hypothetical protein
MKGLSYLFVGVVIFISFFQTVNADWQEDLETQFDIVETFDGLQDWRGVNDLYGYDTNKSHMPKKIDGSNFIWDFHDEWFYVDNNVDWIKFHGVDKVRQGVGKSLRMHLGKTGSASTSDPNPRGSSHSGLYFGSDTPNQADGYAPSRIV